MAGEKISALSAAGALAGTEVAPIVQSAATVKATVQNIANLAPALLVESGAGAKVSALSAASALAGTESVPVVQGGANVKSTIAAILTFIQTASIVFSAATAGIVLKRGANGLCGTFVANGVTPVSVSNSNVAITDAIIISLNTVGGTVGAVPAIQTITGTSGFTVAATVGDTSTYNYAIIKNAA